mgnify:CR=1 FL=1
MVLVFLFSTNGRKRRYNSHCSSGRLRSKGPRTLFITSKTVPTAFTTRIFKQKLTILSNLSFSHSRPCCKPRSSTRHHAILKRSAIPKRSAILRSAIQMRSAIPAPRSAICDPRSAICDPRSCDPCDPSEDFFCATPPQSRTQTTAQANH